MNPIRRVLRRPARLRSNVVVVAGMVCGFAVVEACQGGADDHTSLCGNGVLESHEGCDGAELNDATCESAGSFTGGTLACGGDCTFDTSGCDVSLDCGDGTIGTGEDCDGYDLGGATCESVGSFIGGSLTCGGDCLFDTGACTSGTLRALDADSFLDVTSVGADPTGQTISTVAIQYAIDQASTEGRVVFFPSGTYLVDDTLRCMQPAQTNQDAAHNAYNGGCYLVGTTYGPRPLIQLVDGAAGFDNPSVTKASVVNGVVNVSPTVKPVIQFWRQQTLAKGGSTDVELEDGQRSYNQVIRNIDIDLGNGNTGAMGIRHFSAEGSSIQEVRINARDGFTGLYTFPAGGGTVLNVEVVGGSYGIYAPRTMGGASLLAGLRLSGQLVQPLHSTGQYPMTIVGFEIVHDAGPVFVAENQWHDCSGHLSMVDGTIELTANGSSPILENADRSIYLKNVFVKGAATIVSNATDGPNLAAPSATSWTHIDEYAYLGGDVDAEVDGSATSQTIQTLSTWSGDPPAALVERHLYPADLCSFENPDAVSVREFGAIGDGATDDTDALRAAIAASDIVLLPKGHYQVTDTIDLRSTTHLCGIGVPFSVIAADPSWVEATQPAPILRTPDDPDARVMLDSLQLLTVGTSKRITHLNWRSGRNSVAKNVLPWASGPWPGSFDIPLVRTHINGNGGGRFYGLLSANAWDCMHEGCRVVLVEGTIEPLAFYMYHHQYLKVGGGPLTEIRDAENISIYSQKTETIIPGTEANHESVFGTPWPVLMDITDSRNIWLFGAEGHTQAEPDRGLYEITDSTDISIINIGRRGDNSSAHYDEATWYFVKEAHFGQWATLDAASFLALYRRSP